MNLGERSELRFHVEIRCGANWRALSLSSLESHGSRLWVLERNSERRALSAMRNPTANFNKVNAACDLEE